MLRIRTVWLLEADEFHSHRELKVGELNTPEIEGILPYSTHGERQLEFARYLLFHACCIRNQSVDSHLYM